MRAPDVTFVAADRAAKAPVRGFARFAPHLAVEVVSPGDAWSDVKAKVQQWLAHGVEQVWVVDPKTRTVEIHACGVATRELASGDTLDGGALLPGFACPVADLFA